MARKTDVGQETNQIKEKQKEKGGRDATTGSLKRKQCHNLTSIAFTVTD